MKTLLGDHRRHQSHFQIDRLVIARSGATTYGRYVQGLRELFGRYRAIRGCVLQIEEHEIEIGENQAIMASRNGGTAERKRASLERKRAGIAAADERSRLTGLCYEFSRYFVNCEALRAVLGDMNQECVEQHEKEMMLAQVRISVAKDCLQGRILQPETWQLICCLPKSDRALALSWVESAKDEAVDYFLNMDEPFPELEPSTEQVAMLSDRVVHIIGQNPELDYGAHTYRSNGLQAKEYHSLRGNVLQDHAG